MSKTGAYYLDMREDAENLKKDDFIKKHGEHNLDLWQEVHEELGDIDEMRSRLDQVVSRMNKAFTKKISQ
tara:strand:- start:5689 stop:5898 length:210 start_codon:yes stop_codon:yes gene_type:complete